MSLASLAPAASGGGFHVSTTTLAIIGIVVVLGGIAILGWRAPDRSPHQDERTDRDRIDN